MRARTKSPIPETARSASSSMDRNQCQTWTIAGHSSTFTDTPAASARRPSTSESSSSTSSLPTWINSGGKSCKSAKSGETRGALRSPPGT